MKKSLIFAAIAFAAFTAVVSAQSYTFSNNLTVGSSGDDVSNLQSWLMSNGYDISAISSGIAGRGFFGSQTRAALVRYQGDNGVPTTGFFGPLTRDHINHDGGNDNRGNSLRVTSPNGGDMWQTGSIRYITWTAASGLANQTADIKLEFAIPACAQSGQPVNCMIAVRAPLTIASGVNLNAGSYAWNVGNGPWTTAQGPCSVNDCPYPNTAVPDGQYKIQICPTNGSQCDESDSYFNIISGTVSNSQTPVINGIDAPTSLSVNQTGTWTVHATDPLNGTLSYSVDWGDAPVVGTNAYSGISTQSFLQSTTFTHSYSIAGTYTVRFTVRNGSGLTVQTSSTIMVGNLNIAGPLKIISPNGGEVWLRGTAQNITWTSPYYFAAATADLKITRTYVCATGMMCPQIAYAPYTIATNIPINQNSYSWNVGSAMNYSNGSQALPDGQYSVQICQSGTSVCDSSDNAFTITSGTTASPAINVISPNGGENWNNGSTHQIMWTYSNADANSKVDLYLGHLIYPPCASPIGGVPPACTPQFQTQYVLDKNVAANAMYNWIVGTDTNNNAVQVGTYVVEVCQAGSTSNCDTSNAQFTIY